MSYVIGSPFVLREGYGLSANQFALLFAINGVALVGGAQINVSLVRWVSPIRIVRCALPLLLAALTAPPPNRALPIPHQDPWDRAQGVDQLPPPVNKSSARRVGISTADAQRGYPAAIVSIGNTVAVRD